MDLISGSNSVGQNLYHLEWCSKYRYKMFMKEENKNLSQLASLSYDELVKKSLNIRSIEMSDFDDAFESVKTPLSKISMKKYEQWNREYGE